MNENKYYDLIDSKIDDFIRISSKKVSEKGYLQLVELKDGLQEDIDYLYNLYTNETDVQVKQDILDAGHQVYLFNLQIESFLEDGGNSSYYEPFVFEIAIPESFMENDY